MNHAVKIPNKQPWWLRIKSDPSIDTFNKRYVTKEEVIARKKYLQEFNARIDDNSWWETSLNKI